MTNNGSDKLIAGILEEAQSNAAAIERKAADDVAAIQQKLSEDRERIHAEYSEKAEALKADILKKARTNAELEGRKELLKSKRALIDAVFAEAYKRLLALKGEKREGVLLRLLKSECSGNETVCPAKADRAALTKLLPECGIDGLTLGEDADIEGGFILKGSNYIKNCSFAALIDDIRGGATEKVASILFS